MRHALAGHETIYPAWAVALDMARGDPLRAKEIFIDLDQLWFDRWMNWRAEHSAVRKQPQ